MLEFKSKKVSSEVLIKEITKELTKLDKVVDESSKLETPSSTYTIGDFMNYHDEEFIKFAYKAILGREPDPEGFRHYLGKLRSGEFTRTDVIVRLRYSQEGRAKGVKILGIGKRAIYSYLSHVPVLGFIIKTLKFFFTVPKFMKLMNFLENSIYRNFQLMEKRVQLLESKQEEDISYITSELIEEKGNSLVLRAKLKKLEDKLEEESIPSKITVKIRDLNLDRSLDYYSNFENIFRGTSSEIKERLAQYLKFIPENLAKNYPVLDVGCGRGEFLELLSQRGINAVGIDLNRYTIAHLRERGFEVYNNDVNSYLKRAKGQFSAITAFQVIEHFDPDYLKEFLTLTYEKLVPGGVLILETLNPWNFEAFPRFYIDETHVKPIPPDTLTFILNWVGFKDLNLIFSSPLKEKKRKDDDLKKFYLDYAIVGYKR
ncbi:O-antigen chain-terminating methyltransferase [Thermovibrio guaymasensis]|uniref:O-antigen chain-terminating methyltransferase n=1 Tax=Thermovibrio guaymasensis TaxID=240167 RepID=A0A420W6A4_9BACT|nr:methyltransferase domain-containing protein [Thermovibrio guaymasensis]RKQ60624.1 O-antigen chain-terminating methyltransferase [Thermovibrio guaymasensis]